VFKAGVALVRVDVQAVGRNGRSVTGLTREDFLVYDENQPQQVAYFGRESEPLDLVLLLDVSGSMHRSLAEMAAAAQTALRQLHTGDRVAVFYFARRAELTHHYTSDFRAVEEDIRAALRPRDLGGGTLLNPAILTATEYVAKYPVRGRRAVLVLTDNDGVNYQSPDEEVLRALWSADSVLNAIVVRKVRRVGAYLNPDYTPFDVHKLAAQSGGEAVEAARMSETFPQMIERIRTRYSLAYNAPQAEPGSFRRIRVELAPEARRRHPDAVLRARAGYYTPTDPPSRAATGGSGRPVPKNRRDGCMTPADSRTALPVIMEASIRQRRTSGGSDRSSALYYLSARRMHPSS